MKYLFIVLLLIPTLSFSQLKVKLTNTKTNKELLIEEGTRVALLMQGEYKGKVGVLDKISHETLTIDGNEFQISSIKNFGTKKRGSGFVQKVFIFFGTALISSLIIPDRDPCPSCIDTTPNQGLHSGDVLVAAVGGTLIALAINNGVKNTAKPISTGKWTLEIIDENFLEVENVVEEIPE